MFSKTKNSFPPGNGFSASAGHGQPSIGLVGPILSGTDIFTLKNFTWQNLHDEIKGNVIDWIRQLIVGIYKESEFSISYSIAFRVDRGRYEQEENILSLYLGNR